uniref:FHF complex subunit HOOK-interacting protein C-terminal domain-containing protein n=1 Tax=Poecilia formosa TaxID=48698 RepID=A0A087YJW5_POEFO
MMASVVAGGNRKKSLTLRGVDPETCMIVFKNHWMQVVKILEKHEPSRSSSRALSFLSGHHGNSSSGSRTFHLGPIPADEASAVQNYVEHMLFLLMEEEAGQGGAMGPILEFVVLEGVMERLFLWSLRRQFTEDMKLEQLRMYQMLLSQAKQPLLHHKPVLRPLMMLLTSCAGAATDAGGLVEAELVQLLNQLCVALVKDPSVLELFFHTSQDQGAANFLLFSLLIPYTHRQGLVGQQARDALLLIMSLSASELRVAQHIAENTYFCPVLATGLSGLYSSLPARLQVYSEDWHCLESADWQQVPALVHFLHSLDFCSAVTKVAHPSIRSQLLSYIYNGFLVPVLAPALHKLTVEEVMTTTAYLDLFLRSISEPALLQNFLSFILLHRHDNVHILDTLVSRVNTPFQLGTVSLALFRTLIGLFCEDVMLQLVFRYLIPCSHLSRKQRCSLKRDCYSSSAASFLLLMPSWCPMYINNRHSVHIHWPKAAGDRYTYCDSVFVSDLSVSDSVGYSRGSDFLMDVNYVHYLWDARQAISISCSACRFWSAAYDGFDPPPQDYRSDTPVLRPPSALSPTPSSSDTVSTSNQAGRASSAMELEWDDIFAEEDLSSSSAIPPPPLPPRHIQEMRLTATKLVRGAYIEESEFQDDVIVYDLVAQKDTKTALFERIKAANRRQSRESFSKSGRTVMETVSSIMSTEDCDRSATNTQNSTAPANRNSKNDFLSQYHELMRSLGVEPDGDDITDDVGSFRRRVRALRQKLAEEEEQLVSGFSSSSSNRQGGPFTGLCVFLQCRTRRGEIVMQCGTKFIYYFITSPTTPGPFISVLLSRLENLLENSIAVNLLVTGILAQLASYPQPLLRSFLLSTETHDQHSVRTLYQVLVSVHAQIERYVENRPEYPALVTQAWRFLLAKDQDGKFREALQSQGGDIILDPSRPNGSVRNALPLPPLSVLPPCPAIPPHAKSRVFAIVMFAEFLKELAAIAQEHSVALDCCSEE